jgi:hypothetical protein
VARGGAAFEDHMLIRSYDQVQPTILCEGHVNTTCISLISPVLSDRGPDFVRAFMSSSSVSLTHSSD